MSGVARVCHSSQVIRETASVSHTHVGRFVLIGCHTGGLSLGGAAAEAATEVGASNVALTTVAVYCVCSECRMQTAAVRLSV